MSRDCNLIKLKRGLASDWSSINPVLKLGEPGYEKDTKKLKIGDGVTAWNDLPYIGEGTIDFEDVQDEVANFLKAGNNIFLDYDDPNNILTISATGLQPEGDYATLVGGLVPEDQLPSYVDDVLEFASLATFPSPGEQGKIYVALDSNKVYRWSGSTYIEISSGPSSSDDIPEGVNNLYYTKDRINELLQAGSNISLDYDSVNIVISATGLQPSGNYSLEGHTHTTSEITDFSTGVSGLLPAVEGSGFVVSSFEDNVYTISVSGLQPSGDYSLVGHSHLSSDITDFDSSVSGLLTVVDILGGDNISVSSLDGSFTISATGLSLVDHTHPELQQQIDDLDVYAQDVRSDVDSLEIYAQDIRSDVDDIVNNFDASVSGLLPVKNILAGDNVEVTSIDGIFTVSATGLQPSGDYSLVGHSHLSSDITDFDSSVSGLLPAVQGSGFVVSSFEDNVYTIGVSGLQPSGDYSLVGHSHLSSDITDFDSSVSGLLPAVQGSGFVVSSFEDNVYTIGVSGLQPSGDYSLVGHSHLSSDITDFDSSVSGLLTVVDILGGDNISVSSLDGSFTISATGLSLVDHTHPELQQQIDDLDVYTQDIRSDVDGLEIYAQDIRSDVDDIVNNFDSSVSGLLPVKDVLAGDNVEVTSLEGIFTISATGLQPSGDYSIIGHTHVVNDITDINNSFRKIQNITLGFSLPAPITAEKNTEYFLNNTNLQGPYTKGTFVINDPPTNSPSSIGDSYIVYKPSVTMHNVEVGGVVYPSSSTSPFYIYRHLAVDNFTRSWKTSLFSLVGHTHTSSNITDFNTSVSGLLPVKDIIAGSGIGVGVVGSDYTISVSGLDSSYITDFDSSVSGLLPAVEGSGFVVSSFEDNVYTISVSGLQPSGDYSLVGHSHLSSDITDFDSSVSGLLTVVDILGGDNISVSSLDGSFTISATGLSLVDHTHPELQQQIDDLDVYAQDVRSDVDSLEIYAQDIRSDVDDIVNNFDASVSGLLPVKNILAGDNVEVTSLDGIFTISATGLQPSGDYSLVGHSHTSSDIIDFNSSVSGLIQVKDIIGGDNIEISSLDGTYTISASGLASGSGVTINNSGDNRILTSDGTSSGINAESNFIYEDNISRVKIIRYNENPASPARLSLIRNRGSAIDPQPLASGDFIGRIDFRALDTSNEEVVIADIVAYTNDGLSTYDQPAGTIRFRTRDTDGTFGQILIQEDGTFNPQNGAVVFDKAIGTIGDPDRVSALQVFNIPQADVLQNQVSQAILGYCSATVDSNSSQSYISGIRADAYMAVPSGTYNQGGGIIGCAITAARNEKIDYDDNGRVAGIIGLNVRYGHNAVNDCSPLTDSIVGYVATPVANKGNITSCIDILLQNTEIEPPGAGSIDQRLGIVQQSADPNTLEGSLTVRGGLSAPTKVFSLGSVSNNVNINYGINKQIQTCSLDGTITNFILGSGWWNGDPFDTTSVDVILEITVNSPTTVLWSIVDDWYNQPPDFNVEGKHLILFRGIKTSNADPYIIQGHYIGSKTN